MADVRVVVHTRLGRVRAAGGPLVDAELSREAEVA
jgi:hypothetical protein